MTIGAWVGAGVGLTGLLITLITATVNITSAFTKLDTTMQSLGDKISDINCENKVQHDNLFGLAREHGEKLNDHETRIQIIEKQPTRKRTA